MVTLVATDLLPTLGSCLCPGCDCGRACAMCFWPERPMRGLKMLLLVTLECGCAVEQPRVARVVCCPEICPYPLLL